MIKHQILILFIVTVVAVWVVLKIRCNRKDCNGKNGNTD